MLGLFAPAQMGILFIVFTATLLPACTQHEDHITESLGYYERIYTGTPGNLVRAAGEVMKDMDMTIDSEDISPYEATLRGTTAQGEPVKVHSQWLSVEQARLGVRVGSGVYEDDPRGKEILKKVAGKLNPRAVPRESIQYPEDFPERLRY